MVSRGFAWTGPDKSGGGISQVGDFFQRSNERLHRVLALERTQHGDISYGMYVSAPKHACYLALARRKRSLFSMPSINNAPPSLSPGDTTAVERMGLTVCHGMITWNRQSQTQQIAPVSGKITPFWRVERRVSVCKVALQRSVPTLITSSHTRRAIFHSQRRQRHIG